MILNSLPVLAAASRCRHCRSELTLTLVDLGLSPVANDYVDPENSGKAEPFYPLKALVCRDCRLVQTSDMLAADDIFRADYAYFSSHSSSWLNHAKTYVEDMIARFGLNEASRHVEIASNDGYLLQYSMAKGIQCLGIEPCESVALVGKAKGIDTRMRFFGVQYAHELVREGWTADLITANNVLAHVPDINDFVGGFTRLLKPHGVATFEFPHLLRMVQGCQFDTAYHEHYSYLSLTAVQRIFAANGLVVIDVQELPTHGGSLRVFAARADTVGHPQASDEGAVRVQQLLATEAAAGMLRAGFYSDFQAQAIRVKRELLTFLLQCQADGITVGAYGAAAKGNTLLNFAGVRPDLLPYVVDKNPAKQGQYLPGSHIPVVSEAHLRAHQPQRILILPWNLRSEVADQLDYTRSWGAQMVVAVPRLEVF